MAPNPKFYKIPKWRDFQHYKDRSPPWIKLHFDLLTSETWLSLDDASRVLAVASMLIASRNEGRIPGSPTYMQRVAYLSGPANFAPLVECGFLVVDEGFASDDADSASKLANNASKSLAGCKQLLADASPETETETEKSKPTSDDVGSHQPAADSLPACPHQEIISQYAKHLPELPHPRAWDGQRANNLKARWRWVLAAKKPNGDRYATDAATALDFFERFFGYVAKSDFLTGRNGKWQSCNLAWLVKAENFAKVLEGQYENRQEGAA